MNRFALTLRELTLRIPEWTTPELAITSNCLDEHDSLERAEVFLGGLSVATHETGFSLHRPLPLQHPDFRTNPAVEQVPIWDEAWRGNDRVITAVTLLQPPPAISSGL